MASCREPAALDGRIRRLRGVEAADTQTAGGRGSEAEQVRDGTVRQRRIQDLVENLLLVLESNGGWVNLRGTGIRGVDLIQKEYRGACLRGMDFWRDYLGEIRHSERFWC